MSLELKTTKEVFEALLAGHKIFNNVYGFSSENEEHHFYLDPESGFICEEDGAGLKPHRFGDILFRDQNTWYKIRDTLKDKQ